MQIARQMKEQTTVRQGIGIMRALPALTLIAVLLILATGCESENKKAHIANNAVPTRIISLAPNITETLFALGLGDHVAGVTRFCTYPPETANVPKVGGYFDPNYEAIAAIEPDLALLLPEQSSVKAYLDELEIRHHTVENRTVEHIIESIRSIAALCGADSAGAVIIADIEAGLKRVRNDDITMKKPRILISVGRSAGEGKMGELYAAGHGTNYDEFITIAGGINAYSGPAIQYPTLSVEGVLSLDPDIIIDMVPVTNGEAPDTELILKDWATVPGLRAYKNDTIHVISDDYAFIPGPRFILFIEDIAAIIREHVKQ